MKTTVVNCRTEAFDVYIGRACTRAADRRCHKASVFANPYRVGVPGHCGLVIASREGAVESYEWWLRAELKVNPGLRERLLALKGKRLGCWCAPGACHGDVLVKLLHEQIANRKSAHGKLGRARR